MNETTTSEGHQLSDGEASVAVNAREVENVSPEEDDVNTLAAPPPPREGGAQRCEPIDTATETSGYSPGKTNLKNPREGSDGAIDGAAEDEDGAGGNEPVDGGNTDAEGPVSRGFKCPQIPIMVIVLLVFTSLAQGFSSSAISLFINMDLAFEPVEVTRYWMFIGYTAWCQPAIGYLADALVVFREKRRPLFIVSAVGSTIIYAIFFFTPSSTSSFGAFVGISVVAQFCMMGLYIPLNGLVVEVGRVDGETTEESMARMGAIMSRTMVWRSIGSLIGTIFQTLLVLKINAHGLLGITAILFFILIPLVLLTPRILFIRRTAQDSNFYKRLAVAGKMVWRSFDIHDYRSDGFCFVLVLIFVFVYTMMPDASSVYYNYLYGAFFFPTWFYSMNNCIGYVGSIAGAYAFTLWMDYKARRESEGHARTSIFFMFMIGSLAWAFGYLTNLFLCTGFVENYLGIAAIAYIPVDNFFMSMFVRFAFMPTIAMAAEHAPKDFEATTFEVFSVASMGGGSVSALITSFIAEDLHITRADYSKLWILILISIIGKLVLIPVALLLPERRISTEMNVDGDEDDTQEENDEGYGEEDAPIDGEAVPFRKGSVPCDVSVNSEKSKK